MWILWYANVAWLNSGIGARVHCHGHTDTLQAKPYAVSRRAGSKNSKKYAKAAFVINFGPISSLGVLYYIYQIWYIGLDLERL